MFKDVLTKGMKLVIALSMVPVSLAPSASFAGAAPAPQCPAKMDPCDAAVTEFRVVDDSGLKATQTGSMGARIFEGGVAQKNLSQSNVAAATKAKTVCEAESKKCKSPKPCNEKLCAQFRKHIADMDAAIAANAASVTGAGESADMAKAAPTSNTAGSGSGFGMKEIGMLAAGAGMGLLAASMMNKKDDGQQQQQMQVMYNGALQANGTIDCSKPDALFYRDCNGQIEARCKATMDDPLCQQFSSRYCGAAVGAAPAVVAAPMMPPNVVFAQDPSYLYGATGEGVGSAYCKGVVAWNFCKGADRASCPSCAQIARNQNPICQSNPAACVAQNSSTEAEKARQACPTDPAFSDPAFAASVASNGGAIAGGLATTVLPQSVGGDGNANANANGATATTVLPQSAGYKMSQQSVIGSSGGESTAYAGGGREFASASSAGGGGMARANVASANTRPAPDIEAKFGPDLFVTSSQAIRQAIAGRIAPASTGAESYR